MEKCVFSEKNFKKWKVFLKYFILWQSEQLLASSEFSMFPSCLLNVAVICFAVNVGEAEVEIFLRSLRGLPDTFSPLLSTQKAVQRLVGFHI